MSVGSLWTSKSVRRAAWIGGAVAAAGAVAAGFAWFRQAGADARPATDATPRVEVARGSLPAGEVALTAEQQEAIGMETAPATSGPTFDVLKAPGQIAADEARFAYIIPRAAGVVRSVNVRIGQSVKAGDLLATIDSAPVAQARLTLYTQLQALEVAETMARWQERIFRNTGNLVKALREGATPTAIHEQFKDHPVGLNRERLMTAYAQFRLTQVTLERNQDLHAKRLITPKQFQEVTARHEAAQATYQALMDQMGFDARLAMIRAEQALRQAETAVRVAREQLRVLGVDPDEVRPVAGGGTIVRTRPDGTPAPSGEPVSGESAPVEPGSDEALLVTPSAGGGAGAVGPPTIAAGHGSGAEADTPVSTYSLRAPFDGTVLDRELIVPGIYVDMTNRIFTLADLSSVWVQVDVHESDFDDLTRSAGARVLFNSPAFPGRDFEGEVIYNGDMVNPQSRTVRLLARAENPDRLLKPGMFVGVRVLSPGREPAPHVPRTAILTEGDVDFVYVQVGPERFERRGVRIGERDGDLVAVLDGVAAGERVVTHGGFKLKAKAIELASAEAGTTP